MKSLIRVAVMLASAMNATAQTYNPPNGHKILLNVQVTRTDLGDEAHLKITFTVPPASEAMPVTTQAFLYGWIASSKQRLMVSQSKGAESPEGFLAVRRTFVPGETVTLETDLPKSFVDAVGAHLHAGLGAAGKGYYPTQNLLVQK